MIDFVIIQSGDQVKPQSEPATAIAIPLGNDAKDFQMPNHVLDHYPLARQLAVGAPLCGTQLAAFRLFSWRLRVFVFSLQTLITGIREQTNVFGNRKVRLFEQRKVVRFARRLSGTNNFSPRLFDDNLCFYRGSLLLARIIPALFFFGRSIGVSPASTIINSNVFPLFCRTFLPGNFKSAQCLSRFSILTIVRETVASDNCQRLAIWNCVRYSRQYSSVNNTWSSTDNVQGLPDFLCTRVRSSRTNSHILAKVSGLTPQYRLKSSGESDLIC